MNLKYLKNVSSYDLLIKKVRKDDYKDKDQVDVHV